MKKTIPMFLLIGTLVLPLSAYCDDGRQECTRTIAVWLRVNEAGDEITIDKDVHQSAALLWGDELEWKCACPDGVEFKVKDVRHLVDLDEAADLFHTILTMEGAERSRAIQDYVNQLEERAEKGPEEKRPFQEDPPDEFRSGRASFLSGPYREIAEHHLYKFTWVIRRKGDEDPSSWEEWDPHFSGHRPDNPGN
jgi:hypothetical protein